MPPYYTGESIRSELAVRGRRMRDMLGGLADGVDFCCMEEYVFEFGEVQRKFYSKPDDCAVMKEGRCFDNAMALSRMSCGQLIYTEGFAGHGAVHHAWCTDINNVIVDPTWIGRDDDDSLGPYIGCKFYDIDHAIRLLLSTDSTALNMFLCAGATLTPYSASHVLSTKREITLPYVYGPWLTKSHMSKLIKMNDSYLDKTEDGESP